MNTFESYEKVVANVPLSLRNNRDRIDLPVMGLQESAGKIGSMLTKVTATGTLSLTPDQGGELKDRLSDILWCVARLCRETGIPMDDVAVHSVAQITARAREFDPDQR